MGERARVTSIEAIESFRESLIIFLSKARPALEEVSDEVRRTRMWLEDDQREHWEGEARRRRRDFEQAQQELFGAKLSKLQKVTAAQQLAVTRARRALQEAEEKLRVVKTWNRDFENVTLPLVKQMDQLHSFLAADMPHAIAYLAEVVRTLEAYAETTVAGPLVSHTPPPEAPAEVKPSTENAEVPENSHPLDESVPSPAETQIVQNATNKGIS